MCWLIYAVLPALLLCACSGEKTRTTTYEFTDIRRGTLERTVSVSGTIKPVATVRVIPQMSGKVERVYVDYNDIVKAGEQAAARNTGQRSNTGISGLLTGAQTNSAQPMPESGGGTRTAVVMRNLWYLNDSGKFEVIQVRTGISNGQLTEIMLNDEFEGRQVILRERIQP